MWYTYVLPPVLGGVIGYITNDLAIKMLFHPHQPWYVFGKRVPMTPGLIPKEKERIAQSIGEAVSKNLMDHDTMQKNLLSDEMLEKIRQGVQSFCDKQKENQQTVREFACNYFSKEDVDGMSERAVTSFSSKIGEKITNSNLGEEIAQKVVDYAKEKVGNIPMAGLFIGSIIESLKSNLTKHLNVILEENSGEIVERMVGNQVHDFMEKPVCDFFRGKEESIEKAKEMVVSAYHSIITDHLPHLLEAVDIQKIVEERLKEMDVVEMESLIMQVMKKELKYIVWIGALLGTLIGCINILI